MREESNMQSFSVIGGQCPRRILDAQKIYNYLQANSLKHTPFPREADIIFVNTCGGFTSGEAQSLHTIKTILKTKREDSDLIITGCLVKINPHILDRFADHGILDYDNLYRVDSLINAHTSFAQFSDANLLRDIPLLYSTPFSLRKVLHHPVLTQCGLTP